MRIKLGRSIPLGGSSILIPPRSSDEENTLWFTSTLTMSRYLVTAQYGPYGLSGV